MLASLCPAARVGLVVSALLLSSALVGCHSHPTSVPVVSASVVRPVTSRSSSTLSGIGAVQRSALYQQAERACSMGQYARAATLLQRLDATPGFSADQRAFCNAQRDLCLNHLAAPAAPSRASLPARPASAASPADADCGPRALAVVCRQLGVPAEVARLRVLSGTNAKGTSMAGLAKACEAVGLKAEGVQVSREALGDIELPALAWVNQNHYVALLSVQGDAASGTATIADPNTAGEQTIERERLLRMCGGYLLLVHR